MPSYPEEDFPWTFYFNGVAMPKWGANWPSLGPGNHHNWDWDIGPRDFYVIRCKIDRVGSIESANAHAFLYAVQEVLCMLFTERENVLKDIERWLGERADPREVYEGLTETAFQMRDLTRRDGVAFWVSGYKHDRAELLEAMRRAMLSPDDPEFVAPPHIKNRTVLLQQLWKEQIKMLHLAAGSKTTSKAHRKRLMEM